MEISWSLDALVNSPLWCRLISRNMKYAFFVSLQHWDDTGCSNPPIWKIMTYSSCIYIIMAAEELETQRVMAILDMILILSSRNIPGSTPEDWDKCPEKVFECRETAQKIWTHEIEGISGVRPDVDQVSMGSTRAYPLLSYFMARSNDTDMSKWHWRYKSRSKVRIQGTPFLRGEYMYLYQVWKIPPVKGKLWCGHDFVPVFFPKS